MSPAVPLPPGSTIGMLGGGQLGRMTALAAAHLGYRIHVFCPDPESPCAQVCAAETLSSYEDAAALTAFARQVDVVTLEFENVPVSALETLAPLVPVRPGPQALAVCQDRLDEKRFVRDCGIGTAPYAPVGSLEELTAALAEIGRPAVLKARRLGYDGKSQALIGADSDPAEAWDRIGRAPAILEGLVTFSRELSVIAARGPGGQTACYPAVENRHAHHILSETLAPAPNLSPELATQAETLARTLIDRLDLVGLLAVELFETADGRLLVNELAPRPHNSGHWTIDACATSQFEQLVRSVCGLPLGTTDVTAPAVMTNLLGDQADRWPEILAEPGAQLHLYGKGEARQGRKMGHVTRMKPA